MTDKAYAVPLHELLTKVPRDARLVIDDTDSMGTRFIPVGRYCHEAAEALRARLAQPENKFNPDWDAMAVMVEEQQRITKRIEELEAQLAQPEPEPLWIRNEKGKLELHAPPQREWVGLTEDDFAIWKEPAIGILRWAEATLKEKNNGR